MHMSLLQKVEAYLALVLGESNVTFSPKDKVVTAVSGGPDSLTLLHLLAKEGLHPPENIIVAHLDHQLRPSSSAEAEAVCQITAEWGLACRLKRVDVQAIAQEEGLSLEEAGRQERYRFFGEIAAEFNANFIFTGHHADDQVETVLMHLLRGSGSAGLRGILPVSTLSGHPGRWLVRPLLNTSREEIETYYQDHHLQPLMDESNTDTTFFRNRLRHDLFPILESYNPQIRERLLAMAAVTAADFDWLQQQMAEAWVDILWDWGDEWLQLDLAGWQRLPLSLRRGTLRMGVAELRPNLRDVGFETIEQARQVGEKGQVGSQSTLPGDIRLMIGYSDMTLRLAMVELPHSEHPQLPSDEPLQLSIPGRLSLGNGWVLHCEILSDLPPEVILHNDNPWIVYMDIGDVDSLIVRPRLPGERFQPFGMMHHTKSVKAMMIDRKIPAELRPRWPIVAGENLFWIPGLMMDERVRVSPKSKRTLKLTLEKLDS